MEAAFRVPDSFCEFGALQKAVGSRCVERDMPMYMLPNVKARRSLSVQKYFDARV
jgi:hypothetical protein